MTFQCLNGSTTFLCPTNEMEIKLVKFRAKSVWHSQDTPDDYQPLPSIDVIWLQSTSWISHTYFNSIKPFNMGLGFKSLQSPASFFHNPSSPDDDFFLKWSKRVTRALQCANRIPRPSVNTWWVGREKVLTLRSLNAQVNNKQSSRWPPFF